MSRTDEKFDEIAQDVITRASAVRCPIEDYIAGLRYIQSEIDTAVEAAQQDLVRR